MSRLWTVPVFLCALVSQSIALGADQKPLVLARIVDSPLTELGMRIVGEAYSRIGVAVEFRLMPGARALKSSNAGTMDGELFRVGGMAKRYPNLVQVPVPITRTDFVVFTREPPFRVAGYASLEPYRIAFRRGMKIVEDGTEGMTRFLAADTKQAFAMLDHDRVDVVIENRLAGLQVIRDLGLRNVNVLDSPLNLDPLYHYVHKSHADLVPRLTAALEAMREEGMMQRLEDEAVRALIN